MYIITCRSYDNSNGIEIVERRWVCDPGDRGKIARKLLGNGLLRDSAGWVHLSAR